MKIRVAIGPSSFANVDKTPLEMLARAGIEVVPNLYGRRLTKEEIIRHLDGVDGLLAGLEPLSRDVMKSIPTLRAIARVGAGMTNVDIDAARELGIKVSNTPDAPTEAVAEMTVAAILSLCRRLVPTNTAMHSGKWDKSIGIGLRGTVVLIVGYGRIGWRVSHLLQAFGAEILVVDPAVGEEELRFAERLVSLSEGLGHAQIITLHAGGTRTILGAEEFERMGDGVLLANSARAALVDEYALLCNLDSGKVAAAWLDVFWEEPYSGKLTEYPQVLLTPHISTYTRQCRLEMETAAVENLLRDLKS